MKKKNIKVIEIKLTIKQLISFTIINQKFIFGKKKKKFKTK